MKESRKINMFTSLYLPQQKMTIFLAGLRALSNTAF